MSTREPTVSVVIPLYNAVRYLEQAIASVQKQTWTDWEIIIVDDASTDGSTALAVELAASDPRIRLFMNERNCGVVESRNRGIREARGLWVAMLDSDDFWAPTKLEKQLALAQKTGADIIFCSYDLIDGEGRAFGKSFIVPESTSLEDTLIRSVISCSTALVRLNVLLEHPFRMGYAHEDLVLWLELLSSGVRAAGCREVLACYRVLENSRSGNKLIAAAGRWDIYRNYMHLPFFRSLFLLLRYAFLALHKYKRT